VALGGLGGLRPRNGSLAGRHHRLLKLPYAVTLLACGRPITWSPGLLVALGNARRNFCLIGLTFILPIGLLV
jgi:hypothetical protein